MTEPRLRSFEGLSSASRNRRFLGSTIVTMGGGVGGWATGSEARMSAGRRSGSGSVLLKDFLFPAVDMLGFVAVMSCKVDVASSSLEGCLLSLRRSFLDVAACAFKWASLTLRFSFCASDCL